MHIISGGQTGVDRAALDVALAFGLPCGGWCPRGRGAEDGPLPARYPLMETPSDDPAERTRWNVRDADGTLILVRYTISGGTALAAACAEQMGKPLRIVDLDRPPAFTEILTWLSGAGITVLNIAGPRESERPGIQAEAMRFLSLLFMDINRIR